MLQGPSTFLGSHWILCEDWMRRGKSRPDFRKQEVAESPPRTHGSSALPQTPPGPCCPYHAALAIGEGQ